MSDNSKVFSSPDISGMVILFTGKNSAEFASIVAQNITANQMSVLAGYFKLQADMMLMAEEQRKMENAQKQDIAVQEKQILRPN